MKAAPVVLATCAAVILCAENPILAQTSQPTGAQQYPHQLSAAELRARIPDSTAYAPGNFGPRTYATYRTPDGHIT